ncbi:MAG TPA: hypothetical protein VNZ84_07625 [Methylophilus sp.]|nr:hypothetical protein [Methylophilus sp.]
MADHVDQTQTTPANPTSPAKVKDKRQPSPNADLEAEIATEVEHGQLTDDELNSGNDI